ncbi:MAG TPA: isocitrate lyase/PEP mutase family protein [Casimicrobiaceae bacterium]|jgi:2-methylisocitrate lyase-like PEP mutase family enzyme|nr:isocitrate lyase/PEP mutase family protein [Casimicrobiaceae bacterium]
MSRATLRSALAAETPLVTPLAHDALSARLIERAGFRAFAIGGSAMLAARYALPDIGLAARGEMADGIRDIAAATTVPFLADGDDGYGDVKSVALTVASYERLGVGGILIEDQRRDRKQPRAEGAKGVVDMAEMTAKLRAAMAARRDPETLIIGRTDAYGALGLDAAIERARAFVALGVDAVFVAGLKREEEYARVGRELAGATLSAAVFEGVGTPWLTPAALGAMGYRHVSFPATLLFRAVGTMRDTLAALRRHADGTATMQPAGDAGQSRATLDAALDLGRWQAIEAEFATPGVPADGKGA